jgi:hypothetical protein
MPRHPAALVVAEAVSIDQLTGRITAFNMLDLIFAQDLPALLNRVTVVAAYDLSDAREVVFERAVLLDPDDHEVASTDPVKVEFNARTAGKPGPISHTTIHTFWNTTVRADGDYSLALQHAAAADGPWNTEVARRRLVIIKAPHPLAPPRPVAAG